MGVPGNNLDDLERQRLELESNILKLQESLYHWRTWEAEYDGLKEEIGDLDDDATTDDFLRVGRDFGGTLVNEDEMKVILGEKQGMSRSRQQVVDLLSRRVDYVKQNVTTMEKRLRAAEDQLYALDSFEQRSTDTGADFPMTEIMEEIDEDGKVISSSTSTPGDQAPQLLEVLKKAGVKDIPEVPETGSKAAVSESTSQPEQKKEKKEEVDNASTKQEPTNTSLEADEDSETEFVEDIAPTNPPSDDQKERPVTDVDESPEDANLRREMLQYGLDLDEVGAVVAELELDDDASDVSYDDGYGDYDSDEDEEEDEHGRTKGRVLDEEYHQQMRELEAKLNARGMWNMGKDTGSLPAEMQQDLDKPAVVKVDHQPDESAQPKKPKKKVAFADDLDIAPASKPAVAEKTPPRQSNVQVLSDSVVERTEPAEKTVPTGPPKKASRFKSARKATANGASEDTAPPLPPSNSNTRPTELRSSIRKPDASSSLPLFPAKPAEPKPFSQPISDVVEKPSAPQPPKDKIVADTLLEREVSEGDAIAPEADELDEQLHRKEIATEFYHLRNRKIQQNGGFVNDEEPEIVPIETEEAPKRVSKFKAARMR
ncbi:hypothetical protein ASPWEDRAFT_47629 [Aspergillus wentii DTO 134E9]|uniref:DUF3835 domain-containing protein n=1 Tax=Aspergillus wentii DTO 134E9 TaxID=1073089 RepID=A0A1L9S1B2_ASPWE|nr:uncharacterized protein ASPWEDRAFT_47629 [Aspergillus wentii DTO 134E9]OJJ40946.1 hypothetical protein ASPWEDRAFT_47629 [Aspergillus wentii DTO 134E9]